MLRLAFRTALGRRVTVLAILAVIAASGGVVALGFAQQSASASAAAGERAANLLLAATDAQDSALRTYAASGSISDASAYSVADQATNDAQLALASYASDPQVARPVTHVVRAVEAWQVQAGAAESSIALNGAVTGANARATDLARIRSYDATTLLAFQAERAASLTRSTMIAAIAIPLVIILLAAWEQWFIVRRIEYQQGLMSGAAVFSAQQAEFADAIQIADSEDEVHGLLKHQLARVVPGSHSTVLRRNNSENRLEPVTGLPPAASVDAEALKPRDCLAIRFARSMQSSEADAPGASLETCKICSRSGNAQRLCIPSVIRGEVIGSVLVVGDFECTPQYRQRVESTVAQASPVLGTLRTLARAESQAATDGLTGLPNSRSFQEALIRLTASAMRSGRPLSALMLDVDHFKRVNDHFGHDRGDQVLASVAATIARSIRASDFAARYGGEEFVVLLPDTDSDGASELAEKLRTVIACTPLNAIGTLTASIGVATMCDHTPDGDALVKAADHALYIAKEHGRNRVEVAAEPEVADASPIGPSRGPDSFAGRHSFALQP
jgi:diguanylate cyclase (GGDEF)-like protein